MRPVLKRICKGSYLGAVIGGVAGYITAPDLPEIIPAGAFIGAMVGLMFAARMGMHGCIHDNIEQYKHSGKSTGGPAIPLNHAARDSADAPVRGSIHDHSSGP